mmetsp:Transcript_16118/g.34848  ORF Transcript_16118/g.34848 Transcript_16118/m.34848 type:complete len:111 (+) Transcript_16118:569-901(+)
MSKQNRIGAPNTISVIQQTWLKMNQLTTKQSYTTHHLTQLIAKYVNTKDLLVPTIVKYAKCAYWSLITTVLGSIIASDSTITESLFFYYFTLYRDARMAVASLDLSSTKV